jgi:hypothetical protein
MSIGNLTPTHIYFSKTTFKTKSLLRIIITKGIPYKRISGLRYSIQLITGLIDLTVDDTV